MQTRLLCHNPRLMKKLVLLAGIAAPAVFCVALISAQQLRAEIREQAEREAQLILREARAEAERLQDKMKQDLRALQDQVAALERARRSYLAQLRLLVERQLAEIDASENATQRAPQGGEGDGGDSQRSVASATPSWLDSLLKE